MMNIIAIKNSAVDAVKGLFKTGFFHIVGAGSLNKALSVLLGIILVRVLSKADYGSYAYAYNIVSFFILFNGFGVTSAVLQICSETYNDKNRADANFAYAYKAGILVDCFMAAAILLAAIAVPLAIQGSNNLLALYCLYPLLMLLYEMKLMQLRVNLKNKEYAFATNVQTCLLVVFSILGAFLFQAAGLVVGQGVAFLLAYVFLCWKFPFRRTTRLKLDGPGKKDFWGIAGISAFNNGIGQALTLIGTFLVGLFSMSDELVANYQVATLVPFGLLFIPVMIMTYCYPYFARHKDDRMWTLRNYAKVIGGSLVGMATISLLICFLTEPIVVILFGQQYLDIVPIIRLLMAGFFVTAALRIPTGNLLVTQRKLLFNTYVGVASIVICAISSYLLIPLHGMIGAAIAYDLTMFFGAVCNVPFYLLTVSKIKIMKRP